jgi:hypothetical protein
MSLEMNTILNTLYEIDLFTLFYVYAGELLAFGGYDYKTDKYVTSIESYIASQWDIKVESGFTQGSIAMIIKDCNA